MKRIFHIDKRVTQENTAILNMCVSNKIASKFTMQELTELMGKIDKSPIIIKDLQHSFCRN